MESNNDPQLKRLLKEWQVSNAPEHLERRVLGQLTRPWWRILMTARIRIPVPVAVATAAALVWLAILVLRTAVPVSAPPAPGIDLRGFQPVDYVNVRIERGTNAKQ